MYDLDEHRVTAVFVDDRVPVTPTRSVRRVIGETVEKMLTDKDELKTAIKSADLLAIAERDRFGQPTGICEIGEGAGAEVLIYVTVDQFTLTTDQHSLSPTASCRVKVMDCREKKRLWPNPGAAGGAEWQPVVVTPPSRNRPLPASPSERTTEYDKLARVLGEAVANLFIKHERRPIGKGTAS
jgi:hypothetical protein